MRILLFGKNGQVGSIISKNKNVISLSREDVNLDNPDACYKKILELDVDIVINAAAYTDVENAEDNELLAFMVNAESPKKMAEACNIKSIPLIHLSTDYVFDGNSKRHYHENDKTNPKSVYGHSKLIGEKNVQKFCKKHVILRTSWIFSDTGNNFFNTMRNLSSKKNINVISDQIGGPTSAYSIADTCMKIAKNLYEGSEFYGIFNFQGKPETSWAEFSKEIFKQIDSSTEVNEIKSSEYISKAKRPKYSSLNCFKIEKVFKIQTPNWRNDLKTIIGK